MGRRLVWLLRAAVTASVAIGTASFAQDAPPVPGEAARDIVVTGAPPNSGLVVDISRVALRCAACRRALARLRDAALPARQRIEQNRHAVREDNAIDREQRSPGLSSESIANRMVSEMRARAAYEGQVIYRRDSAEVAAPFAQASALYLQNLMRHVAPIVERLRRERNVQSVYAPDHPLARRRRFPDLTNEVIRALDRDQQSMDLLAGIPLPPPPRR
jgi:hypothetical protein